MKKANHVQLLLVRQIFYAMCLCLLLGCAEIREDVSIFTVTGEYQEPVEGLYLVVRNEMTYKTLWGPETLEIQFVRIDGKYVKFPQGKKTIPYSEEIRVRIAPGEHRVAVYLKEEGYGYITINIDASTNDILLKATCPFPGSWRLTEYILKKTEKEPTTTEGDTFKKLEKLKELYDKGIISKDDYEKKRKELLDNIR